MNIIILDVERKRRVHEQSLALLRRMAIALLSTYGVKHELNLAALIGYEPELTNEAAMTRWITENLVEIDQRIADAVFPTLCDRLQRVLTRLPAHQQGGL